MPGARAGPQNADNVSNELHRPGPKPRPSKSPLPRTWPPGTWPPSRAHSGAPRGHRGPLKQDTGVDVCTARTDGCSYAAQEQGEGARNPPRKGRTSVGLEGELQLTPQSMRGTVCGTPKRPEVELGCPRRAGRTAAPNQQHHGPQNPDKTFKARLSGRKTHGNQTSCSLGMEEQHGRVWEWSQGRTASGRPAQSASRPTARGPLPRTQAPRTPALPVPG